MVNFVVCDDNKDDLKFISNTIDNVMMKNRMEYKKHLFNEYNEKFENETMDNKLSNKVYILDIQTPTRSGIDVARDIRKNDVDSILIFLTSFNELGMTILTSELMVLTFINKMDNKEERLKSALEKSLKILGIKNVIRFNDHGVVYTIPANDILYITRDTIERKCIIKTDYNNFKVRKSLTELSNILGENFIETHRSCIVNMTRVRKIDKKKRVITFDNNEFTDLLSETYKREVEV